MTIHNSCPNRKYVRKQFKARRWRGFMACEVGLRFTKAQIGFMVSYVIGEVILFEGGISRRALEAVL